MTTEGVPALTLKITSKRFNQLQSNISQQLNNNSHRDGGSAGSAGAAPTPGRSREEELREVFRHFDIDGDGKISPYELRVNFGSNGEYLSYEDAERVIGELDSESGRDGMLDFKDFVRMMDNEKGKIVGGGGGGAERTKDDEDGDDLRKAFEMFEHEKGSGRITPGGLQRMLGRLGDSKSHDECAAMIQRYDVDGDGELDFHEFRQMMS